MSAVDLPLPAPQPAPQPAAGSRLRLWWEATRPKTLVLSVLLVTVGTGASGRWIWWRFVAALVTGVTYQIGTNLANDYYDARNGVDDPAKRVGPRRLTASGLVSPRAMRTATLVVFAVSTVPILVLTLVIGPELILAYIPAMLAGVGYSGGPKPISGIGLGEVLDFALAGPVGTVGAAYIQTDHFRLAAFAAAVPVGLLAASMLLINNIRDIATDGSAGKVTLAVKLGDERSRKLFVSLLAGAIVSVPLVAAAVHSPWPLLALIAAPLAVLPVRAIRSASDPRSLIRSLEAVSRLAIAFAGLLTLGLVLA